MKHPLQINQKIEIYMFYNQGKSIEWLAKLYGQSTVSIALIIGHYNKKSKEGKSYIDWLPVKKSKDDLNREFIANKLKLHKKTSH